MSQPTRGQDHRCGDSCPIHTQTGTTAIWTLEGFRPGEENDIAPRRYSNPEGLCNQCKAYAGSVTVKLCPLHAQAPAMQEALDQMLAVKRAADGGGTLLSNQGQALDGYSELANYRAILEAIEA